MQRAKHATLFRCEVEGPPEEETMKCVGLRERTWSKMSSDTAVGHCWGTDGIDVHDSLIESAISSLRRLVLLVCVLKG